MALTTIRDAGLPAGSVLQVVQDTQLTGLTTTSTSFADNAGLSVSITPQSTSNKILVLAQFGMYANNSWSGGIGYYTIFRDSTNLGDSTVGAVAIYQNVSGSATQAGSINYLDSPATTSAITYTMQMRTANASHSIGIGTYGAGNGLNTITVMEIAG
jgi:hypothetical protein